jgi:hypothetical protein
MISFIKNNNQIGIVLFKIFLFKISKNKGMLIDSIDIYINIWKFRLCFSLGKEKSNVKKVKQELKEQQNYDAFA